ncbi:MAG: DNA mismatch repair endonuclease MutL [Candidatus Krumholzibacteriota bacterium]|nr:DNA mismatch repair endonuclease MutL [Candidatus Krumholzibacteriota bacterium]
MRRPIRPLAPETVNRIAAGEVVERPASVLKELLENSLDAGARRLELEIAGGGVALVRLADDGFGIPRDELAEALERHSTSKITTLADLAKGETLGFRGEALAAIAAVSRLELSSRVAEDESGWILAARGGESGTVRPQARGRGTTVAVRDLFADLPARRKFLGSEAAEKRRLLALWHTYALAYPEVEFVLREGGRELSRHVAAAGLHERAGQILGGGTVRHMVEVDAADGDTRLTGLASLPLVSRGNRSHQFLFLGRRPIQDAQVSHAISQAYREVLAPGRYPACLLFLELPSGQVDVNVHPAKREVRWRDGRRIHHLVGEGLRHAIGGRGDLGRFLAEHGDLQVGAPRDAAGATAKAAAGDRAAGARAAAGGRQAEMDLPPGGGRGAPRPAGAGSAWHTADLVRLHAGAEGGEREAMRHEERLFWQLHSTFILTQIRGGLVIIDQHNAHERVLYDRARAALAGRPAGTQRLLFPHTVELSAQEMAAWREQAPLFKDLGFDIEAFGESTLSVSGIPDGLQRWDGGETLRDILDDLLEERGGAGAKRDRALMSYACKSAIKAGEPLREEEMRNLVDRLFGTENPYTCPHGRPIVIRISMDELEKRFQRQVPGPAGQAAEDGAG